MQIKTTIFILILFSISLKGQKIGINTIDPLATLDIFSNTEGNALRIVKENIGESTAVNIISRNNSGALGVSGEVPMNVAFFHASEGGTAVIGLTGSSSAANGSPSLGGRFSTEDSNGNGVLGEVRGLSNSPSPLTEQGYGGYFTSRVLNAGGVFGEGFRGVFGKSARDNGTGGYFLSTGNNSTGIYAEGQIAGDFEGDVMVSQNISVSGLVDVGGDLSVGNNLNCLNDLIVEDALAVGGKTTFEDDIEIENGLFAKASNGRVGIGTVTPDRELHVHDTNNNGDAIAEFSSSSGNLIVGMNISSGGIVGTTTKKPLSLITNNSSRMVITEDGNIGMGKSTADVRLDVSGSIRYTGTITDVSDVRFKKDIHTIDHALEKVLQLRGVTYHYKREEFKEMNFDDKRQIGFIAQELEPLFPELVKTDKEGFKSVDYVSMSAVLVQALNEQQLIIANLKAKSIDNDSEIKLLKSQMENRLTKLEKQIKLQY